MQSRFMKENVKKKIEIHIVCLDKGLDYLIVYIGLDGFVYSVTIS